MNISMTSRVLTLTNLELSYVDHQLASTGKMSALAAVHARPRRSMYRLRSASLFCKLVHTSTLTANKGVLHPCTSVLMHSAGGRGGGADSSQMCGPSASVKPCRNLAEHTRSAAARYSGSYWIFTLRSCCGDAQAGVEAAPMLGVRASPSGRYVLVLLRAAPSEIWTVGFLSFWLH